MESKYLTRKLFSNVVLPFQKINPKHFSGINLPWSTDKYGDYIIIKDDKGFGSGKGFKYRIGKINILNEVLIEFADRDIDFIIEPFLFQEDTLRSTILKIHAYNRILPSEVISYEYQYKSVSGKLGKETIESIDSKIPDSLPEEFPLNAINEAVARSLPFHMVSLDFVENPITKNWYCIDINHSCSSWGEVQEKGGNVNFTIFDHMLEELEKYDSAAIKKSLQDLNNLINAQEL